MHKLIQRALLRYGILVQRPGPFHATIARLSLLNGGFTFAQVGAFDGVSHDTLYWLVVKYNGSGLAVEPTTAAYRRLKANYEWLPRVKTLRCAIHPTAADVTLFYAKPGTSHVPEWIYGATSISRTWLIDKGVPESSIEEEVVPARSLDAVLRASDFSTPDVVQIDAEGFDYDILQSLDFKRHLPLVLKFESPRPGTENSMQRRVLTELSQLEYELSYDGENRVAIQRQVL